MRPSRRALGCRLLESLEGRQLLTAVDQFIGITPPVLGQQELVTFNSASGTLTNIAQVSGLVSGESLFAIATDPKNGELYGVGVGLLTTHLYAINPTNADATPVGTGFTGLVSDLAAITSLGSIAAAFDPVSGDLRIVSAVGTNMTIDPATGALDTSDTAVTLSSTLTVPQALAYTNNVAGATETTAYLTDEIGDLDQLGSTNGSPNGASSGDVTYIGNGGSILTGLGRQLVIVGQNTAFEYGALLGITPTLESVNLQTGALSNPVTLSGDLLSFTAAAGAATSFKVTGFPSTAVAGTPETITVTAEDAFGNTATGYGGTVAISSSDSQAGLPAGATLVNGVGTFQVTLKTAGAESIAATDTTSPSLTGTETGISVTPAAASHLSVTGATGGIAGTPESITVTALDPYGNTATGYTGTVHFASSDPLAALPANATLTNGTGTFSTTLKTAATDSISATDTSNPSISGSETGIAVTPAAISHFSLTGAAGGVAGTPETITLTALDPYGNTVTGYTGTVHFSSSDPQAALPANSTLTNGTGTFSATLKTAGSDILIGADTSNPSISGSESNIAITPAAASQLVVTGAGGGTAGTPETFTVTAKDPYGNTATGYTGTVVFASSDPQANLPANSTLSNGVGTFSATLKTAGADSISAADSTNPSLDGSESGIAVTPAAISHFSLTGASGGVAGTPETITITALDPYGNTVTGYTGTIHFSSNDPQAALPANSTLTNGTGTFTAILKTAGSDILIGADTSNPSISGSESNIAITPAAATHLTVTGVSGGTAGTSKTVTVTALDPYGNTATGYTGTIHFSSNDPQAALPADTTLTNGTGSYSVIFKTVGSDSISAVDTLNPSLSSSEPGISVTPAAASQLVVTGAGGGTAGTPETFTITAKDPYGNTATGYTGTVVFASSDPQANLPANSTLSNGVGTFSATLKTAGADSISAADTSNPSLDGSESGIAVTPAAISHFSLTGASGGVAGTPETITITALDPYGNTVTGYTGIVHFSSSDPQANLPADATLTNGVGTFSVTLKTSGSDSVSVSDTESQSLSGSEPAITVTPGPAFDFTVVPIVGSPNFYTVTAFDQYGNLATTYAGTVHLTSSDPSALLPANSTLTDGVGIFRVILETSGSQSITVTDTTNPGLTSTQGNLTALSFTGTVYLDANASSSMVAGETGLAGRVVFLDINHDGKLDPGDPEATTDSSGHFTLYGGVAGEFTLLEATSLDSSMRYVVDQTQVVGAAENIGVVPYSPVVPVPVVPNPFGGTASLNSNDEYVQSLYRAVLGRVGNQSEVASWVTKMSQGTTKQQVAQDFFNSFEHRQDEVDAFYEEFLHRAADPYSVNWVDDLIAGASEESIAEAILDSTEYQSAHQSNNLFVQGLYSDVLGRQGDSSGVASWTSLLASGASRQTIVADFIGSAEAVDQVVESFYVSYLHRGGEQAGFQNWVTLLQGGTSGSTVALDFLTSPEFEEDSTQI